MKIILLRDVAKIGRRAQVVEVPDGHALNFLIPRKMAIIATADALRKLEVEHKKKAIMTDRHDESFKAALENLEGVPVTIALAANAQGHLFKGVHRADIKEGLKAKGMNIEESEITLVTPIKQIGEYTIPVERGGTKGVVKVHITSA